MKINKATYLSIFFLLCFVTSFSFNAVQNYNTKISKEILSKRNAVTVSSKEDPSGNGNTFVFEKNENETESESNFNVQAIILPFLISFISVEEIHSFVIQTQPLSAKQTNPIYISVCNFRI